MKDYKINFTKWKLAQYRYRYRSFQSTISLFYSSCKWNPAPFSEFFVFQALESTGIRTWQRKHGFVEKFVGISIIFTWYFQSSFVRIFFSTFVLSEFPFNFSEGMFSYLNFILFPPLKITTFTCIFFWDGV